MPKSKNKRDGGGGGEADKSDDKAEKSSIKDADELKASSTSEVTADSTNDAKEDDGGPGKEQSGSGESSADADNDKTANKAKGDAATSAPDASTRKKKTSNDAQDGNSERKGRQQTPSSRDTSSTKNTTDGGAACANDDGNASQDDGARSRQQHESYNGKKQPSGTSNPCRALSSAAAVNSAPATSTTMPQQSAPCGGKPSDPNKDSDVFDDDYSDAKDTLLTMAFNQDGGCLAVGTGGGFRICNAHPFQETFRRSLGGDGGAEGGAGIAHIEMLYRTNLLALTGHSTSPHYPPNKVLIYDDHLQRTIGELSFRQKVLTTKLRRDRIVVVLRDRVYIYNFSDLALLDKVHTGDNPLGLIGISMDNGGVGGSTTSVERAEDVLGSTGGSAGSATQRNNGMVLACPGTQRGQVRVELYGLRRTTVVDAHESALGALALSVDGSLLATASERGTVIRLFDTRGVTIGGGSNHGVSGTRTEGASSVSSSVPLREFRRGVERATVSCLTFSLDSNWLGCASNHGTVHVFQTHDPNASDSAVTAKKKRSMTGKAIRMLPKLVSAPKKYLMDGVHSYAQVRGVPHPRACAFVPDRKQTIAVAGVDEYGNGCLLLAEFGARPVGGKEGGGAVGESKSDVDSTEARRLGYHRFFKRMSPSSQCGGRRRTKSKEKNAEDAVAEGGAYIDDAPVDMRMNHISIGDENEDDFVPIDYNSEEKK